MTMREIQDAIHKSGKTTVLILQRSAPNSGVLTAVLGDITLWPASTDEAIAGARGQTWLLPYFPSHRRAHT